MSKKNNRKIRARQQEFDEKREKLQLEKTAKKLKVKGDKMKIDHGKVKKRQFKVGKKRKFKAGKGKTEGMEID